MAHEWHHPNYYKKLKREATSSKPQAASSKPQATSSKPKRSVRKILEPRSTNQLEKIQASSSKPQAPRTLEQVSWCTDRGPGPG